MTSGGILKVPLVTLPGTRGQSALEHKDIALFSCFGDQNYAFRGKHQQLDTMYRRVNRKSFEQARRGNARKSLVRKPRRGELPSPAQAQALKDKRGGDVSLHSTATGLDTTQYSLAALEATHQSAHSVQSILPPMKPVTDAAPPSARSFVSVGNRDWFDRVGTKNPLRQEPKEEEARSPGRLSCFIGAALPTIPQKQREKKKKRGLQIPQKPASPRDDGALPESERAQPVRLPSATVNHRHQHQPPSARRVMISPAAVPAETQAPCPALSLAGRWVVTDVAPASRRRRQSPAGSPATTATAASPTTQASARTVTVRGAVLPQLGRPMPAQITPRE